MYRIIFLLTLISTQPVFSQTQSIQIKTGLAFSSERFLGVKNKHRYSNKDTTKLYLKFDKDNLSSQIALNYNKYDNFNLDKSYLWYWLQYN